MSVLQPGYMITDIVSQMCIIAIAALSIIGIYVYSRNRIPLKTGRTIAISRIAAGLRVQAAESARDNSYEHAALSATVLAVLLQRLEVDKQLKRLIMEEK